jgi:predicted PurR-regulated permease PerM
MRPPGNIIEVLRNPWVHLALELLLVAALVWLLRELSGVLTPLLIGLVLAYMLDPIVTWLAGRRLRRSVASTVVFGTGALLLVGGLVIGIPTAWQEGRNLYRMAFVGDDWNDKNDDGVWQKEEEGPLTEDWNHNGVRDPSHFQALRDLLVRKGWVKADDPSAVQAKRPEWANSFDPQHWLNKEFDKIAAAFSANDRSIITQVGSAIGALGWWFLTVLLIPIYAYFFSLHLPAVSAVITSHIPAAHRERTLRILSQIHQVVGAFFRGRIVVCFILSALAIVGFAVARVPSSWMLGLLMGFGTAIPLAAGLTLIPVAMLLYLSGADPSQYYIAITTFIVIQGLETLLISIVMGKGVEMHPVLVLVAILAFGSLLGAVGILLAVPLAATARILIREFVYPELRRLAGLDQSGPASANASDR